MSDLVGKVALVTGAGAGIGRALAEDLADRGCKVVIGDIRGAEDVAASLIAKGRDAIGLKMDVTNEEQIREAVNATRSQFGGVDVLVNNAGLYTNLTRAPFEELSVDEWEKVFAVNVIGVFRVVKAFAPLLRKSAAGRVINITSATAFSAPPNMLHYVSTKGALTTMTRSLARELGGDGVTVNAVAPGFTLSSGVLEVANESQQAQMERARSVRAIKRDQMPDDLIGAVCFLSSDQASFITGQTLVVDGGAVMH